MPSNTIPLAMPEDLLEEIKGAAAETHLSMADVMRQSMKLGLPKLREQLGHSGRVTNVDPLPKKVLERMYARPEEDDEAGVRRFIAAQAFGGED